MNWSTKDIQPQTRKQALITGASGGLGFETAVVLAANGATVIVATRNAQKGAAAVGKLGSQARFEPLDLADLASVAAFADRLTNEGRPIDILINNAGLAAPPKRAITRDGFELQFGTNFLGHFALTARLIPLLREAASPRVVTVSSIFHKGTINFDDLMSEHRYSPVKSYSQSKLANLIFARELQRRSDALGWGLLSVAAHPGIAATELTKSRPNQPVLWFNRIGDLINPIIGQSAGQGALPILYAATAAEIAPGGYYGPTGPGERKGPVGVADSTAASRDPAIAYQLWKAAERLTGLVI